MSGLEKILLKIESDGKDQAQQIVKAAEEKAAEKRLDAENEATIEAKRIIFEAEKQAELIRKSGESGADAYIKRSSLAAKAEVINAAIAYAQDKLIDSGEYFDLLYKLIIKNAHEESGILHLNERDKNILPKDFQAKINDALSEKGGSLTLSDEPCGINGGFILSYGGIEENCAFSELIAEKSDIIKDRLYRIIK